MTNLNNVNIKQSTNQPSKYSNFVENTKKTVRNALVNTGIGVSSMMPMATPSIPTVVPASVNTITAMAPMATTIKAISLGTAAGLLTACGGGEDGPDTPINPVEKDTTAPTIDISISEIDITGGKEVKINGNKLYIGDKLVASRSDDKTANCNVTLGLNGKSITSGSTIDDDGTLTISVKDAAGNIKNADIKLDKYKTMEITNIKPSDILPIIGQVEVGDKEAYNHIEHLRLAEATRIRDMMWEYGAGNHSKEEYQKLMSRLNTGMMEEYPLGYDNFEILGGGEFGDEGNEHSHTERSILDALVNHANLKVVFSYPEGRWDKMKTFIQENPNSISILGCSACREFDTKEHFNKQQKENDKVRELCKSKKLIIFKSGGNIGEENGILKNKCFHRDVNGDEHGIYSLQSNANGKNDNVADIALLITIGTNREGDIDQTNETFGSMIPTGFHPDILFAGRIFPYHSINSGKIESKTGKYPTSFPNYVNVAMMDICFQMFAEVKDVDELLDMVRSTCLTDYIRFDLNGNGNTNDIVDGQPETQPLQLINPAGFFQQYLMPNELPSNIKPGEYINLKKGYYKGIVFDIPGTEVKINGEWIEYSEKNKSLIKSQNPMNLQWRINGDLCKKLYSEGKTIQGKIIVVDDKWNGLNIDKDFSLHIQ